MTDTKVNAKSVNLQSIVSMALAGALIAVAGTAYLILTSKYNDPIMGSVLFSFGLYYICCYGLMLYTGRIGYIRKDTCLLLFVMAVVNILASFCTGYIIGSTNVNLMLVADGVLQTKLDKNLLSVTIDSIMCGMLMFLAVDGFKSGFETKVLTTIYCVSIFVLCGFEHCVANAAYIGLSTELTLEKTLFVILNVLGNSIGSILCHKLKTFALNRE